MSNTVEIWTHLLENGICATLEIAKDLDMKPQKVHSALSMMVRHKEVRRYEKKEGDPESRLGYGVTGECVTPYGVRLKEIIK